MLNRAKHLEETRPQAWANTVIGKKLSKLVLVFGPLFNVEMKQIIGSVSF